MRRPLVTVALATASLALAPVVAIASPSDVQANNPQVAGVSDSNTSAVFPTNKQNEPSIAVNPMDSSHLIAGSNDEQKQPACGQGRGPDALPSDCGFVFGVGTNGIYTSSDGGESWTNRGLIDAQSGWPVKDVISDGDPVIAYGPKPDAEGHYSWANGERAYYASLATVTTMKGYEYIIVSHSDDNGATWSPPTTASTRTNAAQFNDKNWITVDDNASSPYFGQVYVSWTAFRSATVRGYGNEPVMVSVSTDGGASFGKPKQLSPAGNNGTSNGRQGTSSSVGPDGTVYIAFEQGHSQVVTVSGDGGRSWTRPMTVGPVADIQDPIPGANFRTDSFPVIAADPSRSGVVWAAWSTLTADGGRMVVTSSTDSGRTWSTPHQVGGADQGYAFFPGLDVAPNGRVDLAWQGLMASDPKTFGTGKATIDAYYSSLAPDGTTWSSP